MSNAEIQARYNIVSRSYGKDVIGFNITVDNIVCDTCEMGFAVYCAGRACHCPVCGARLEFPRHSKEPDVTTYEMTTVDE